MSVVRTLIIVPLRHIKLLKNVKIFTIATNLESKSKSNEEGRYNIKMMLEFKKVI